MPDARAFLQGWAARFFRNKDAVLRQTVDVAEGDGWITVKYPHKEVRAIILPDLTEMDPASLQGKGEHLVVVTLNTERNVEAVVKKWDALARHPSLSFYFVNPWSDGKWALNPRLHDQVSDARSLRQGLLSLFAMVPALDEREIAERLHGAGGQSPRGHEG
ncbi:MAG TPA: hypothetical protein VJC16_01820 [Candidatus Nanoarchaeia archaeon]|nr:hypothetical protein [Candidatus Nanoarchaeia archaeon]